MAVRNLAAAPGTLTSKDKLPQRRYAVRCIEESFVESKSSGNPMIVREWEIVDPEAVSINGMSKIVAGQKVTQYLTVMVKNDDGSRNDEKSDKALARLRDENANLGLPSDSIDDENPQLCCKGIVADAICGSDEYSPREELTAEQRAAGKTLGDPIKYADGTEVKSYRPKLISILGLSSVKVNAAF